MQFLKKNYEKIVLAAVVLAALAIVVYLPIMVSSEKQQLTEKENVVTQPAKPLTPIDFTNVDAFLQRAHMQANLNLSDEHKIFNPFRWQSKGTKIFENPAGIEVKQLTVTNISPLYEVFSLQTVEVSQGSPTRYAIGIKHEAAATTAGRNVKISYVQMNQTTNNITVVGAEGPEDQPTGVTLKLDDGKRVTISHDNPFKRVEGYTADLVYTPDNKTFLNRRKTDPAPISFAGEYYKIVDITESEVVLLQLSNQKQWIRELVNPTNSTAPAQ